MGLLNMGEATTQTRPSGGLMDGIFGRGFDDPKSQAIMAISGGLMRGDFAGGMQDASRVMAGASDARLRREMGQMQMEQHRMALEKAKREAANEQGLLGLQSQFFRQGAPAMGGTAAINEALPPELRIGAQVPMTARPPQFDVKGYTGAALSKGYMHPLEAIKLQQAMSKDTPINKLDVKDFTPASVARFAQSNNYADLERMDKLHFADTGGGIAALNPFSGKPVNTIPKNGDPFKDLVLNDGSGGMRPNSPLIGAKAMIARAGASNVSVNTGQRGLDNELKIRSDFRSEPIYKAHQDVQSAHAQISQALAQGSPAGDLAGATKLMKILDPGSVVRESELGMAMAASGLMDRVTNYGNMVLSGQKLTPTQRKDFQQLADALMGESVKQYNAKRSEYGTFATDYGLNGDRILGKPLASAAKPAGTNAFDTLPKPVQFKGKIATDQQTGKRYRSNGMSWVEVQ